MQSQKGELNNVDYKAIGRGALIAVAGALAVYVAAQLEAIDWATVGQYGFILSPLASIAINALRKWATGK